MSSVERLSALSARVNWIPLTPDEARGILTLLEIAYEPVRVKGCTDFFTMDAELIQMRENLFDQSTAIITGLQPNHEYCVAIKVATSGGESGFSNSVLIPGMSRTTTFSLLAATIPKLSCLAVGVGWGGVWRKGMITNNNYYQVTSIIITINN